MKKEIKQSISEEERASIWDETQGLIEDTVKAILKERGIDNTFFLLFFINRVASDSDETCIETDVTVNGELTIEQFAVMNKEIVQTLLNRYEES